MGMYCCCGARISKSAEEDCTCDWNGWINFIEDGHAPDPTEDGMYLVRYGDNSGDRYEAMMEFRVKPFRIDRGFTGKYPKPIHWKEESWDDKYVYAYKPNKEAHGKHKKT